MFQGRCIDVESEREIQDCPQRREMLHLEQLAEIDKFSRCFPVAEIGGRPVALYNPASGAWTDMIWAGGNLLGGSQFTGSLVPRPADLSGLGTSSVGIPNKNLSIKDILGQPSLGTVPSPGMKLP